MDTNKSTLRIESAMPKILVVEDDELLQLVMQSYLDKIGCVCDVVDCGYEALKFAALHDYQIIFMDLNLPDINGFETAYRIRNENSGCKNSLIVALTAQDLDVVGCQCVKAKMDLFISKPISYEQLAEIVDNCQHQGRDSCLHLSPDCGITQLAVLG